jgi:predicted alpha/beta-hydrolase family hydrolase
LRMPVLFVQGTKDPFASVEELETAAQIIPVKHGRLQIDGAGHDLGFKANRSGPQLPQKVLAEVKIFFSSADWPV